MVIPLVLASGSAVRAKMLRNAGVKFNVSLPRIDEATVKQALLGENFQPRDIADALAEMKARKVSGKNVGEWVLGCDQVLDFKGRLMSKPETRQQAFDHLCEMRSEVHKLFSAAVIFQGGKPVWRHVGQVTLKIRAASDGYLKDYVDRNWDNIRHVVGAYLLEQEGVRLFESIDGDYFHVLGMPLIEILNFLMLRGVIRQ